MTLGLVNEAQRNAAVLGFNYPGDVWYKDAFDMMHGKGLQPMITPVKSKHGVRLPSIPFVHHKALKPPTT